ncbi:MAG: hypothetical protein LBD11_03210, partial [Candidatus Peribacteria bacterium]|nr:hypothetical protein [Candidatus Peribacteria bacterium]
MTTEISKTAFEAVDGKLNGKLSPKQKEYLQNLATNVIKEKNTPDPALAPNSPHSGEVQYFVKPEEKFLHNDPLNKPYNRFHTGGESLRSYENPVEKFDKAFGIKSKLNSLKDVKTRPELQARLSNSQEDAALIQTYLVISGKLKTDKGVKEIDGNPQGKTLQAVQKYRSEEAPRQEQQKKNEEAREKNEAMDKKFFDTILNGLVGNGKYIVDRSKSKNPTIALIESKTIDVKNHNNTTGAINTTKKYLSLSAQVNIKDYINNLKFNQTKFDAEVRKQFDTALKKEQDSQKIHNDEQEKFGKTVKEKNERTNLLNNNEKEMFSTIKNAKYGKPDLNLNNNLTTAKLKAYNTSHPDKALSEQDLTNAFWNKFTGQKIEFDDIKIQGDNLTFALDQTGENKSYMKGLKVALNKVRDNDRTP